MQFILVLISVTLMSTIEAAAFPKMAKPSLNLATFKNETDIQVRVKKLPEERRKLSLFPKSGKKFVVTVEPIQANENPHTRPTKKPLMKKMRFETKSADFKKDIKDFVTESPDEVTKPFNKNILEILKNVEVKEDSPEIVKESSEESKEVNEIVDDEGVQTEMYPINESIETNTEVDEDNAIQKRLTDVINVEISDDDKSAELNDWKEFMFLKPINEAKDKNDEPEKTTTMPSKRVKRTDNVIEEENLGTTISTNKFTWSDRRLTNNLVFKNIHS